MAQRLTIIDYGSGNLRSVEKAFERAAMDSGARVTVSVTDDPAGIRAADRLVLPGVGAFKACMEGLKARPGVLEALEHVAKRLRRYKRRLKDHKQVAAEHEVMQALQYVISPEPEEDEAEVAESGDQPAINVIHPAVVRTLELAGATTLLEADP